MNRILFLQGIQVDSQVLNSCYLLPGHYPVPEIPLTGKKAEALEHQKKLYNFLHTNSEDSVSFQTNRLPKVQ